MYVPAISIMVTRIITLAVIVTALQLFRTAMSRHDHITDMDDNHLVGMFMYVSNWLMTIVQRIINSNAEDTVQRRFQTAEISISKVIMYSKITHA
jgi:hypothetical protein